MFALSGNTRGTDGTDLDARSVQRFSRLDLRHLSA
jgi:hypothetical protein